MAQQIQSAQPSTRSQIIQQAATAKSILETPTSAKQAAEAGKRLLGSFPHAKPADPEGYALSIAMVLQQYPLGVVQNCCDPRTGLAREREFPPTVASIVDWCELRVKRHQGAVIHARQIEAEKEFTEHHRKTMLGRLAELWKGLLKPVAP